MFVVRRKGEEALITLRLSIFQLRDGFWSPRFRILVLMGLEEWMAVKGI